ncbi:MAG TPA: PEP-CTERM system TPR-repeat protein PrsT, partial [Plasticicumulans sp.]|nr:PEP-CTERM system TPR-repeat protein PrsT [Plasticicumulans sp.]
MPRTALYRTRAAVCACVLILSGTGAQADDDVLTAAGRKLEAGQVSAAVIDIKNRLQQRPGDGAARRLLGIAYVRLGDGANAEQELMRAAQLGVPAGELAVPLAEA